MSSHIYKYDDNGNDDDDDVDNDNDDLISQCVPGTETVAVARFLGKQQAIKVFWEFGDHGSYET